MSRPIQRNFIVEDEDDVIINGNDELATIVSRLPSSDTISVTDITSALNCSRTLVYAWIDSGLFKIFDKGGSEKKPFYWVFRKSFIEFLKTRIK